MGSLQTVLPFKLGATDGALTAQGWLALVGEYVRAMSICSLIDQELPRPGSTAGYNPSAHVLPLVLMLAGAGGPAGSASRRRAALSSSTRGNAEQRRHGRLAAAHGREGKRRLAGSATCEPRRFSPLVA